MTSMTGYAYKEAATEKAAVSVEIKSVNSRFLDVSMNIPPALNPLEKQLREKLSQCASRGKIDVFIRLKNFALASTIDVDIKAALSYIDAIKQIADLMGKGDSGIPLSLVASQPGVLNVSEERDVDFYWSIVSPVFDSALQDFVSDKKREGANMERDLLKKLECLDNAASFICGMQGKMEETFKRMILSKFNELLGDKADMQRIMAETASMLVKYTINEEVVRLKSHLSAVHSEIERNQTPGKKLDFLCQEIGRELNTISSKNVFPEVSSVVVGAKDALENIREQARNIE